MLVSRFAEGFADDLLAETAGRIGAWWTEAARTPLTYHPSDFGIDAEAWVENAGEIVYRIAVAAALAFRLDRDRRAVVAAFTALDRAGVLSDLYQGTVPEDLPAQVDARALMLASLAARRCAEAPELASQLEGRASAAEAFAALDAALGRGLFRTELFWILDMLSKLGVIRYDDLGDFTVTPHRVVRDTLFRLGFIDSPYASSAATLTGTTKAARRAVPTGPADEILATFALAAGCAYDCPSPQGLRLPLPRAARVAPGRHPQPGGAAADTRPHMRSLLLLLLIALAACITRANKGVCCVTEADCARLGVDEPRPCDDGQACKAFHCVAAECATSADCTSPDAPVCAEQLCVETCQIDADCPARAAFCDAQDRRCRGCEADAECSSGVCIEADGTCVADPSSVVFVSGTGTDAGECDRAHPCETLAYALDKVTSAGRPIIHVSGALTRVATTLTIAKSVIIDGTGTEIQGPLPVVMVTSGFVTIEGARVSGSTANPSLTVGAGAALRLFDVQLQQGGAHAMGGSLELRRSRLQNSGVECTSGTVTVRENLFETGHVTSSNCQVAIEQNRFLQVVDHVVTCTGGVLSMRNNLVVALSEFSDAIRVFAQAPGSVIAFNTIVNTSVVTMSANALYCEGPLILTSNIIAYNSTSPLSGCEARSSLFDLAGAPDAGGNLVADVETFFRDRAAGDYHLASESPALSRGEPGFVTDDIEGARRPATPDIGAFEAP